MHLRPGQALFLLAIALLTFGVVMVHSAGLTVNAQEVFTIERVFFGRVTLYAAFAVGMLILGSMLPIERVANTAGWRSPVPWIVLGVLGLLLLVHVPGLSREVNGSSRWITVGGVSVQPSEFAKWGMILAIAWYAARRAGSMHRFTTGFVTPLWVVGIACVLIAVEDLGTAALIGLVSAALLVSAGARPLHLALLVPGGIAAFALAVVTSPYRMNRLLAYLNPFDDPRGIGYHIIQSMSAVSGGGVAGRGLGNGVRKFDYLPEDTTDFIFAIICEELGFVGAATIIALYVAFLGFGVATVRGLRHPFERLFATGVMLTIGLQAAINIAVVTGVAPTKGIALPLVSHGGTGWALTAFSIGLVVSMDRRAAAATKLSDHAAESQEAAARTVPT